MNPRRNLRAGIQDAFAQIVAWMSLDYDAADTLHQQALAEGRTWPTNAALLYLLDTALRDTGAPVEDILNGLRSRLAELAAQEDDDDQEGQEDKQQ